MDKAYPKTGIHAAGLCGAIALVCACLCVSGLFAGEKTVDIYKKVVFPYYKNGQLMSKVEAEEADALGMNSEHSRVELSKGVVIYVFETEKELGSVDTRKGPPPLKMRITSKRGYYEKRPFRKNRFETIAHLEDDVKVYRYSRVSYAGKVSLQVDTTISCDNATWHNEQQLLTGTGSVTMVQRDNILRGNNFLYDVKKTAKRNVPKVPGSAKGADSKFGGWFQLEENVSMEILKAPGKDDEAQAGDGIISSHDPSERTVITCRGIGSYNLDTREAHFQDNVIVTRQHMVMKSDYLKAILMPGSQPINNIIAWSNVRIRGRIRKAGGESKKQPVIYDAEGVYARYDARSRELILADPEMKRISTAKYGIDEISDLVLRFDMRTDVLKAHGGKGKAVLNTKISGSKDGDSIPIPTVIMYHKDVFFEKAKNYAVFSGEVKLNREGLTLVSDKLFVEMTPDDKRKPGQSHGVEKMRAVDNVIIERDGTRATATRAEMDTLKKELKLFGPPHPQIEQPGSRFQAPQITSVQKETDRHGRTKNLISANGPGSVVFIPEKHQAAEVSVDSEGLDTSGDATAVRYDKSMEYDETRLYAIFQENVVATSRDYVSHSDELHVLLRENKTVAKDGKEIVRTQIRRIAAMGKATLHWGVRHCEGARIVRDMTDDTVTVYGEDGKLASVWEEKGNNFFAPRITATSSGERIDATGPGKLVLPDGDGKNKAEVTYTGKAVYTSAKGSQKGIALFFDNVVMVRAGMTVTGDEMEAQLEEVDDPSAAAKRSLDTPEGVNAMPRRLKRLIVRGHVVVTRGGQVAKGVYGEVEVKNGGDIIMLKGSDRKMSEVLDSQGIQLFSPNITVWQGSGIIRAAGPGVVNVTSVEAIDGRAARRRGRRGQSAKSEAVKYVIDYDGQLVYNSLARKIKFIDNVRLSQQDLQGRCDRMEILLSSDPDIAGSSESRDKVQVKAIEAFGRTRFKRFEPARISSHKRMHPEDRPGKTVYTKSEEAYYDVPKRIILLSGGPPSPEAIQQTTEYDSRGEAQRSRIYFSAPQVWLDVNKGDVIMRGRPQQTKYLSNTGPIIFDTD